MIKTNYPTKLPRINPSAEAIRLGTSIGRFGHRYDAAKKPIMPATMLPNAAPFLGFFMIKQAKIGTNSVAIEN